MTPAEQAKFQLETDRLRDQQGAELAQTQSANKGSSAKMSFGIFFIALLLSLVADLAEIFTVGTLGWFVGLIVDLILLLLVGFSRGARQQWKKIIGAVVAESIPIIDILPLRTILLVWAFMSSR